MAGRWETVDIKQESSCPAPPASHLPPSRGMLYCPNYSLRCHSHCNIYIYKWYQTTTFSNIYLLLQGCKLRYCNNKIAKYVFDTDVWRYVNKFKREEMKDFEQSCMMHENDTISWYQNIPCTTMYFYELPIVFWATVFVRMCAFSSFWLNYFMLVDKSMFLNCVWNCLSFYAIRLLSRLYINIGTQMTWQLCNIFLWNHLILSCIQKLIIGCRIFLQLQLHIYKAFCIIE